MSNTVKQDLDNFVSGFIDVEKKINKIKTKVSRKKYDTENTLFLYTRVSQRVQEDNTSLELQKITGENLGKSLGLKTVLFNEGGKSSKYEDLHNREILSELLRLIQHDKVKHLYVYDLSRLSRNNTVSFYFQKEMYRKKVKLYTESGRYDFDKSEDKMLFTIISSVNNYENDLRRDKTVKGKIQSVKNGFWKGGIVNFGYYLKNKKVRVNEEESKVVKKMFNMYDNGKSSRDIQSYFSSIGVISRKGKSVWSLETIQSMLKNTIYIGYRDIKIGDFEYRQYNSSIVDNDVWKRVNDKMKTILLRKNQINKTKQFYMLRNIMFCDRCKNIMCGRKVNRKNNVNGENYYYCSSSGYRWKKTGDKIQNKCDMKKSVNITHTDSVVWSSVCDLFENSHELKEMFKKKTLQLKYDEVKDINVEIRKIEQKMKQIKRDINQIQEGIVDTHTNFFKMKLTESMRDKIIENLTSEIDKKESEFQELVVKRESQDSQKSWISWIKKLSRKVDTMRKETDVEVMRDTCEKLIHKILVDYDVETKEHILQIRLKLSLFDDKIQYRNIKNKNEGYDILKGKREKVIKFRRTRQTKKKNQS